MRYVSIIWWRLLCWIRRNHILPWTPFPCKRRESSWCRQTGLSVYSGRLSEYNIRQSMQACPFRLWRNFWSILRIRYRSNYFPYFWKGRPHRLLLKDEICLLLAGVGVRSLNGLAGNILFSVISCCFQQGAPIAHLQYWQKCYVDEIISCVEVEWGHAIGQIVSATHESAGLLHVGSGDVQ